MKTCRNNRRGATAVEMAIVLLTFLILVFGMLDLGIGVFKYHLLAQAARQGARQAIVHGSLATKLGSWGPAAYSGNAADGTAIANYIKPMLADPSNVAITATWIDGGNAPVPPPGNRVTVTVSAPYKPIMLFIFGNQSYTLRASSTMYIAH